MGSVVVPIHQHEIVAYLFEICEKIPNSIYLDTMNLMKKYHDSECTLIDVQVYLEMNKSTIDETIFKKLIHLLQPPPLPREPFFKCSCECNCITHFRDSCYCFYILMKFILIPGSLFGFLGALVWAFTTKR